MARALNNDAITSRATQHLIKTQDTSSGQREQDYYGKRASAELHIFSGAQDERSIASSHGLHEQGEVRDTKM